MTRIELRSRIGSDGVLSLKVPVGLAEADREVIVTVQPTGEPPESENEREEWKRFIEETAGRWEGEPLVRPDQGQFERREGWE